MHFMYEEDPGVLTWIESNVEFRVAAGLGLGLAQGEMRLTAGPRFSLSRISRSTLSSIDAAGVFIDATGQDRLAVEVGWSLDGVPAPPIRLGPRFGFSLGRRIGGEVGESPDEDWDEFSTVRARYTVIHLRPGFGMSVPGEGPVAFSFELAPQIRVLTYGDATYADLVAAYPGAGELPVPQTTVDVGGYLFVGVQIRLGVLGG
jgi:hypothetical protein